MDKLKKAKEHLEAAEQFYTDGEQFYVWSVKEALRSVRCSLEHILSEAKLIYNERDDLMDLFRMLNNAGIRREWLTISRDVVCRLSIYEHKQVPTFYSVINYPVPQWTLEELKDVAGMLYKEASKCIVFA